MPYKLSVGVIILFSSCVGSLLLNFVFSFLSTTNSYCSTNNAIYQLVKETSASEWYSKSQITPAEVLKTDTRNYLAKTYQTNNTPNLVYVSVGTERDGLSGSEGFLYLLPNHSITQYWFDNYWITHLDDSLYCYKIRGF